MQFVIEDVDYCFGVQVFDEDQVECGGFVGIDGGVGEGYGVYGWVVEVEGVVGFVISMFVVLFV